jgi:hypothetical protein
MFVGDMLLMRANRAVLAGGELLWSYVESTDSLAVRRGAMAKHGFTCGCALCSDQARMEAAAAAEAKVCVCV